MGFESGLLLTPDRPAVPYDPENDALYAVWRQTTTPRSWLKYSVVWYSQWLTRAMGAEQFQAYVDRIGYGNRDLTGDPGRNNGLTRAWLGSSLKISPHGQVRFLRRLLARDMGFSGTTHDQVLNTIERFDADGIADPVYGKTGTALTADDQGRRTGEQHGWFIGWIDVPADSLVFVRLNIETGAQSGSAGSRARDLVLRSLGEWTAAR